MKQLDPTIEHDLNTIDSALRDGRVTVTDPAERELQELALLLESDAKRPDPQFATELADLVHDGFPRERRFRPRLPRLRLTRLRAASGVAVAAVLAGVVAVSLQGNDPVPVGGGGGGSLARDDTAAESAPRELSVPDVAAGKSVGSVPPEPLIGGGGNFAPGRRDRHIERSASLTLAASGDELDRVADRIAVVTDRYGGFVLSSQVTSGEEGASGGTFELRIPANRLQPALRDLAALGDVRSRSQSGQDVTREVVTAADRLQAARAERKSLLRRLENATTDTEAEALRRRLDLNAMEIRGLRSELRNLNLRTNYAAVSLSLVQDGESEGSDGGGGGTLDDAVDDALDSLVGSLGIVLRVLGIAVPLGLLATAAWASARVLRRRRREAALS